MAHKTIRAREEAMDARLGKTFCSGWGSDAPDMSGANEAARNQSQLAREQWQDYKTEFAPIIRDQMQQQINVGKNTYDLAREQQDFQLGLARKYDARYWDAVAPIEDQIYAQAREFDTAAERERMAGQARGDVQQAFGNVRQQQRRDMGRMGLNPSDPRYFAMNRELDAQQALATANAMSKTRQAAKDIGWARKVDAAALGRGLAGFSGTSTQQAQGWGGQGMQAGGMGMNAALGGLGGMNSSAGGAGQNFAGAGNTYTNIAGVQQKASDSNMEMLGTLAGAGLGWYMGR